MSKRFEDLSVAGWIPFGSYQGERVMAWGTERILFNPRDDSGCVVKVFSNYVMPRCFNSDRVIKNIFNSMVNYEYNNYLNVPNISEIPLVDNWKDVLNENEKSLEITEMDKRVRSTFKIMPEELKYIIWKAYVYNSENNPSHLNDYVRGQRKWFDDSSYFLGLNSGHKPSNEDCIDYYFKEGISLEFRINFALKNPDFMERVTNSVNLKTANIKEPYQFAA